ncbi:uncharacterized protein MONOS_8220 [Monocercomonoides exilis]|uniref:uncharacterized protein n=1 Tax=Monocercomonoides exilis TaxID=2049356 RepID=UPI00355ACA50|nr:hypothetical protein MONOS_8220 [Monocercomonoides exilis]|eukprot:MONOS_8220.1-p1 / transcript=MONOS_8220.1 / gene=MONOS_8220 / organism=Monocercomonoides_exilis_PA203 / gene_product=unspecified product / transcript_product=unspecified product / location=Mono_scaffold00304:14662-15453(-) / protein_length=92 / sequence_SO=supercontig / SO=protein_coding / is_pseudo=false
MIGGIQTPIGDPGRIVEINEAVSEKAKIQESDEEYKALEDKVFGPEEEEEEAGAEMLHEEESSESDFELVTDTSSDRAGDGADASELEADK